jgi:hypothetical protein
MADRVKCDLIIEYDPYLMLIRPYKMNYLVLRPIFPIFDAGGRTFYFYHCKVCRNDAEGFFFLT